MNKRSPTLKEVAERAGVSPYTISAVLNGSRSNTRVSESTRQRIVAAAAELGYYPNAVARGLQRRRVDTLGVLFGQVEPSLVTNPYAAAILQGILAVSATHHYNVTLFPEPWQNAQVSAPRVQNRLTDGVLIVAPLSNSDMLSALCNVPGLPVVVVSAPAERYGLTSVDIDNCRGAQMAVEHLLSLGHRRIAHIMGDWNHNSTQERQEGYAAALASAGVASRPEYAVYGWYNVDTAQDAARRLMSLPEPPTAIFAGTDLIAIAAMDALQDMGVAVPEQVSVVGFDNIPAAESTTPPLTTIGQPLVEIGELATELLVKSMNGETVPATSHLIEPHVIVRASSAPAPGSAAK